VSTAGPQGQPSQELSDLCAKLIELNLLGISGDESVDRERVCDEIVDVVERLAPYGPGPAAILATGYAQLWIDGCQQKGMDPLAAWRLRHTPPGGG
jgi:hypothetical protein